MCLLRLAPKLDYKHNILGDPMWDLEGYVRDECEVGVVSFAEDLQAPLWETTWGWTCR